MPTTVKVTAHNFPATVTVTSMGVVTCYGHDAAGGEVTARSDSVQTFVLRDGQDWQGIVTDTQSVHVEERVASVPAEACRKPKGEN